VGVSEKNPFCGRGIDIFWNYTIYLSFIIFPKIQQMHENVHLKILLVPMYGLRWTAGRVY